MTAIILAAGKSRRINLTLSEKKKKEFLSQIKSFLPDLSLPPDNSFPKVLLPLGDKPLIGYILARIKELGVERAIIVINPDFNLVREVVERITIRPQVEFVYQKKPLGTGDALRSCVDRLKGGDVLTLCGDTPLLKASTLFGLYQTFKAKNCDLILLSAILANPYGYGRIVRSDGGLNIIEERDADKKVKDICEVNAGVYLFRWQKVAPLLNEIKPSGDPPEYYLTDLVRLLQEKGGRVEVFTTSDQSEILGVNTEKDYRIVRALWQSAIGS
ncbi:MAG: NTP transferase domain-containing protein [candidate division WOR-3 bacterium]